MIALKIILPTLEMATGWRLCYSCFLGNMGLKINKDLCPLCKKYLMFPNAFEKNTLLMKRQRSPPCLWPLVKLSPELVTYYDDDILPFYL
jgi:hypothetical protein